MSPPRASAPSSTAARPAAEYPATVSLTAAFIAHDVRGPLRQVMELAALAAECGDPQEREALLEEVRAVAARTAMLLDHMLTLDRPSTTGHRPPVSLRRVVQAAVSHHRKDAARLGATIRIHGEARVRGDGVLLEQMFRNLIGNALKYRRADVPTVTVRLSHSLDRAQAIVTDDGLGIPESERVSVFEPFVRADGDGRRGYGVGLALAARVAEAHGGTVQAVRPGPDEATRIVVTLAAAKTSTESLESQSVYNLNTNA